MTTQDKETVEALKLLAAWFVQDDAIATKRLSVSDYCKFINAIRYAIAKIRGG